MEIEAEKTDNVCDFSGERKPEPPVVSADDEDSFYEKLTKLNESSGLSLVFNLRETKFDLRRLYQQVTKRGGFYQVIKDEKWDEVESALNLKSSVSMLPAQLQKVYEIHLLQFEHAYWKKTDESNPCPDTTFPRPSSFKVALSCSTGKRKHRESSSPLPHSGCKTVNPNKSKRGSLNSVDEVKKESDALPMKPRTGYLIFLRLECHRLRMIHGEDSGNQNIRNMATHAWKSLSDEGKKPYIDASKMDKERYKREMEEYNKCQGNDENANSDCLRDDNDRRSLQAKANICEKRDDCYRVALQHKADCENIASPDESIVELAVEGMKNAESNDPTFQIDW